MLKCTPSRYKIRQCVCRGRWRQVSNWWMRLWLRRLIVLATSSHSHERLGHFSYLMSACPGDKHLGEPFCNVGFIATVAFEGLGVELTFTVPGHFDLLEPTSRGHH